MGSAGEKTITMDHFIRTQKQRIQPLGFALQGTLPLPLPLPKTIPPNPASRIRLSGTYSRLSIASSKHAMCKSFIKFV